MTFGVEAELLKGFPIFARVFKFVMFEKFARFYNKCENANPLFEKAKKALNGIHMFRTPIIRLRRDKFNLCSKK